MLIRGDRLNDRQRQQVLEAFVHRNTREHTTCAYDLRWGRKAQLPTEAEWLASHAFHFTKDGSRLMANRRHCEPASFAD